MVSPAIYVRSCLRLNRIVRSSWVAGVCRGLPGFTLGEPQGSFRCGPALSMVDSTAGLDLRFRFRCVKTRSTNDDPTLQRRIVGVVVIVHAAGAHGDEVAGFPALPGRQQPVLIDLGTVR